MKQIIITKYGAPEVLQIQEKRNPIPKKDQVLVRNYYAGINFSEIMARMKLYPGAPKPPTCLGSEGCGVIESVGKDVKKYKKGDRVIVLSKHSSYSTHICAESNMVIPLPKEFSFEEGAAFPVIYITAYMMMYDLGNYSKEDTILIHGAGGGVGTAAIQLAQATGGTIIGTASKWKHERLENMGVNYCIDYRNEDVYNKVMKYSGNRGVDLIIDPIGSNNWKISYKCLAKMGKLIIFGDQNFVAGKSLKPFASLKELFAMPTFKPMYLMSQNKSVMGYHLGRLQGAEHKIQKAAKALHQLAKEKKIQPIIDKIFSFTEADKAHTYIQDRKNFGKVLLDFREN